MTSQFRRRPPCVLLPTSYSLGSTTTNSHGVAAFDFPTVSGYDQLVVGPIHASGGILDLLMTDVPDLIQVAVVAPIGNSDQLSLSAVISTAQALPNLCVSRKVFLKYQVNGNTVCGAVRYLPKEDIGIELQLYEIVMGKDFALNCLS